MFFAPLAPVFAAAHVTRNERYPRYEDCTQDGRLTPIAVPPALAVLWESALARDPGVRNARAAGVLSLLTRLTVTSLDQPIRVHHPVTSPTCSCSRTARRSAGQGFSQPPARKPGRGATCA